MKNANKIIILLSFFLLFYTNAGTDTPKRTKLPFKPGEIMKYKITWNGIPVGAFQAEVKPMAKHNNETVWHFETQATSNTFADTFYKIRDKVESFTALDLSKSYLYIADINEGDNHRKQKLTFHWDKLKLHYLKNDKEDRGFRDIMQNTLDPLAMFYYVRFQDWKDKDEIIFRVADGKKCIESNVKINKKKVKIKAAGKKYDTYLVTPDLKSVRGIFQKKKNSTLKIWVSADEKKIPIKIKSKVFIGSFTAKLIEYIEVGKEEYLETVKDTD